MESEKILVPDSLAETLWRLEEVRQGFRPRSDTQVDEALQWILSKQGLKGSYADLFLPTKKDNQGIRLLTGERIVSGAALRHILGEEALRTTIVWNLGSSPAVKKATKSFNGLLDGAYQSARTRELRHPTARETGFYCCTKCTSAFLRTLAVVQPDDWEEILEKGISHIRRSRTPNGRWRAFPFYYTLLTLSGFDAPSAKVELGHAGKVAEKLLKRYQKDDRTSRFRRLVLKAVIEAA